MPISSSRMPRKELKAPARRLFGKRILTLGGLAMLSGCDLTNDKSVNAMLRKMSSFNDDVQALLFDPNKLAPTYPESMITRPFPFNAFYDIDEVPEVDPSTYRLRNRRPRQRQARLDARRTACDAAGKPGDATYLHRRLERDRQMGRRALRRFPRARGRRHDARNTSPSIAPTTTPRASTCRPRCTRRRCSR